MGHKYGLGQCDRCGFEYRLKLLHYEWTGWRVCSTCWDPRPAEMYQRPFKAESPALKDPRPRDIRAADLGKAQGAYQIIGRSWRGTGLDIQGTGAVRA